MGIELKLKRVVQYRLGATDKEEDKIWYCRKCYRAVNRAFHKLGFQPIQVISEGKQGICQGCHNQSED